jgi:hypothetical protein
MPHEKQGISLPDNVASDKFSTGNLHLAELFSNAALCPGGRSCSCRIVQSFWLKHLEQTGHDDQSAIVDFGRGQSSLGQGLIQLGPAQPGRLARLIDGARNAFGKWNDVGHVVPHCSPLSANMSDHYIRAMIGKIAQIKGYATLMHPLFSFAEKRV